MTKVELSAFVDESINESRKLRAEIGETRTGVRRAIDLLKNKQLIALSRVEITDLEAGLELLIDQAYETINAIDDDSMMDRKDKDEAIARIRDAVERHKALLERLASRKESVPSPPENDD